MPTETLALNMQADVVVVGGGPAGLLAALEARRHGADVLLVDEKAEPGGQLFKQIHKFFGSQAHRAGARGFDIGRQLLGELDRTGVRVLLETAVWGVFPGPWLGLASAMKGGSVKAERVVLATGASERGLSFPGWTLPGVMGAGALQTLINYYRVRPGRRAVVIGAGNVGLIVAYQMIQAGIEVLAVAEAAASIGGYAVHAAKLQRMGIPVLTRHTVVRAEGTAAVEAVVLCELSDEWQPVPSSERRFDVDLITLAVGLSPAIELAASTGCELTYDAVLGGYLPRHNGDLETTVPGVYVAGDLAGIEEASTAMEEGRLAGLAAAASLGLLAPELAVRRRREVVMSLSGLRVGPYGAARGAAKERITGDTALPRAPACEVDVESTEAVTSADAPHVLIECPEEIPCNPCETVCPSGAITVGEPIIRRPIFDISKCTNCGLCVAACPGLAVFLIDPEFSSEEGTISLPYELLPLPKSGQQVRVLDRDGVDIGQGRIERVRNSRANDRTPVVTVAVPKCILQSVRHIRW